MKLLSIIITLTSFTAMALGSAVPRGVLLDCTDGNKGATACGSLNSYGNDVFQCNNLRWDWIESCFDPDFPCDNGACAPSPVECYEGQKECQTTFDRGLDGINICKNGNWETLDTCHCTDKPSPQCIPIVPRDNIEARWCTEGEPKCMLRNENGNGGVLFRCKNGFWKTQMHCRPSERCHDGPIPTCSWLDAAAVAEDDNTSATQVRRDDDPTDDHPLFPVCTEGEKRCGIAHELHVDEYAVLVCENGMWEVPMQCGDSPCVFDEQGPYCSDRKLLTRPKEAPNLFNWWAYKVGSLSLQTIRCDAFSQCLMRTRAVVIGA